MSALEKAIASGRQETGSVNRFKEIDLKSYLSVHYEKRKDLLEKCSKRYRRATDLGREETEKAYKSKIEDIPYYHLSNRTQYIAERRTTRFHI